MKWVTLENIGVDRMASIWLIRRWIDPKAEFIFVPAGTKPPAKAEPFDIPGARYSHYGGHCTIHALLNENGIDDPILAQIATIVDEADVIQEINVEPAASGLDLICRGIRRISADDEEALARGCLIYDALYAELSNGTV
jgi:hypothetical protein